MHTYTFILFAMVLSSANLYAKTYVGCDQYEKAALIKLIPEADKAAVKLIGQLRSELKKKHNWNNWRKIHVAGNILHCARFRMEHMTYKCGDTDSSIATAYPYKNLTVLDHSSFFIDGWDDDRVATLVHEATHHCGTNDANYFTSFHPHDQGIIGWQAIADTYSNWLLKGFCIPEVDC